MLHERPASCKVTAALSPAIPAPMIAIRGMVLLLSRSLEMYEHQIVILYHNSWWGGCCGRCDSMKNMSIERGIHRARGYGVDTYHLAKLLCYHWLLCRGADRIDVRRHHPDRGNSDAQGG